MVLCCSWVAVEHFILLSSQICVELLWKIGNNHVVVMFRVSVLFDFLTNEEKNPQNPQKNPETAMCNFEICE